MVGRIWCGLQQRPTPSIYACVPHPAWERAGSGNLPPIYRIKQWWVAAQLWRLGRAGVYFCWESPSLALVRPSVKRSWYHTGCREHTDHSGCREHTVAFCSSPNQHSAFQCSHLWKRSQAQVFPLPLLKTNRRLPSRKK